MAGQSFGQFRREERGALTIFGLFVFILMMVAGGIALDLMRSEVNRARMQYTADRAVLAAASLTQERDAREVVRDYLRAADLDENSIRVSEITSDGGREVILERDLTTQSLFMNVFGIDQLLTPVSASATEKETTLEIALVLDISGSMGGQKIQNMRAAAGDFVREVLAGRERQTSVTIVPYNDRVNLGMELAAYLPTDATHPYSHCVVFGEDAFRTTGIAAGTVLTRMGHFDKNSGTGNTPGLVARPHCTSGNSAEVMAWSNNVAALTAHIDSLNAGNWTAMDLGVRTAALFLDPSLRGSLNAMIADGRAPADFVNQPFDYTEGNNRKVMVVMTDGVNTSQWDVRDDRRSGPSPVWVWRKPATSQEGDATSGTTDAAGGESADSAPSDWSEACRAALLNDESCLQAVADYLAGQSWGAGSYPPVGWDQPPSSEHVYSIWSPTAQAYYVQDGSGGGTYLANPAGGTEAVQIAWPDLLANMSIDHLAYDLMSGMAWADRRDMRRSWLRVHDGTSADINLTRACKAVRDQGVVVYTIAFQAPAGGQAAMKDCAGAAYAGNYFNITDLDVASAFDEILSSMNRLRLVQ